MNEDFLHFVWKFQKFKNRKLKTINEEFLTILVVGEHNLNSGPDFFNSKISIDNQIWAGNIELHLRSSDWYLHDHDKDPNYDNVILHVVWIHNSEVIRKDGTKIPTLELCNYIDKSLLNKYKNLIIRRYNWIPCEKGLTDIDPVFMNNWLERVYFERLEIKHNNLLNELKNCNYHWEQVLFEQLCQSFGLSINKDSFDSLARSLDFNVFVKCCQDQMDLEALFYGQMGMLDKHYEDQYISVIKQKYAYLKKKFELNNVGIIRPKYFRLRPSGFPTIRLSQFANLYAKNFPLFSKVINLFTLEELYDIFYCSASEYWDTHYNFEVPSKQKKKEITKRLIDLIILNTIIPIKYSYSISIGKDISDELIKLATGIQNEDNQIVREFNQIIKVINNGIRSQAVLHLKKNYCQNKKCLDCMIGFNLLKK
jgi:hypothetical protein